MGESDDELQRMLDELETHAIQVEAKVQATHLMQAYFQSQEAFETTREVYDQRDESYLFFGMVYLLGAIIESLAEEHDVGPDEILNDILAVLKE